jgi:hypothetical protein
MIHRNQSVNLQWFNEILLCDGAATKCLKEDFSSYSGAKPIRKEQTLCSVRLSVSCGDVVD